MSQAPSGNQITSTPRRALVVAALFGGLAGWLLAVTTGALNVVPPSIPWSAPIGLFVVAGLVGAIAWSTHQQIQVRRERMEHEHFRAPTALPIIGVPVQLATLDGLDSLLSIVQMPAGIPVATVSINGAKNAGLLAARILGTTDAAIGDLVEAYARDLEQQVEAKNQRLKESL